MTAIKPLRDWMAFPSTDTTMSPTFNPAVRAGSTPCEIGEKALI